MRKAGINVAMGLDDKTINDDEDAVMELRSAHKVHRLGSFELSEPPLDAYEALEIATSTAPASAASRARPGRLAPGMKADAVLVDRVENQPWLDPRSDIVEAFVQRAMGTDVDTVVVGGRVAMEERAGSSLTWKALRRGARVLRQGPERRAPRPRRHARAHQAACAEMVLWLARADGEQSRSTAAE
jgi:cytosine/adenosine deaminase-related metal-dependent hydrolase